MIHTFVTETIDFIFFADTTLLTCVIRGGGQPQSKS